CRSSPWTSIACSASSKRRLTLMRPLLVKRQTSPESGSFRFFPQCEASAASSRCRVLTSFPCAGANQTWLHHTRIEVQSPLAGRLQSTVGVILCDLEIMLCPHTVLLKRPAEPVGLARAGQARGSTGLGGQACVAEISCHGVRGCSR